MGYLLVIFASILLGSFPSIQEYVISTGATPLGMVITCNAVAGLSALLVGIIRKESFKIDLRATGALALIGVCGLFLTDYLLNVAYTMIPVGFTTMIHFIYPSLVTVLMVVFFKEAFSWGKVAAMVLSVLGLLMLTGGNFAGDKRGVIVALITALSYSLYMIANDKTSASTVPLMARSFYINLFVVIAALGCQGVTKSAVLPSGGVNILLSVLVGVMLCTAIVTLNAGIERLGAGKASFINMLEPVTSLVVSTIVFRYNLTLLSVLGSALILGSLFLVAMDGRQVQTEI